MMMQLVERRRLQTSDDSPSCDRTLPLEFNGTDKGKRIPDDKKIGRLREDRTYIRNFQNIFRCLFQDHAISVSLLIFQKLFPNIPFNFVCRVTFVKLIVRSSRIGIEPEFTGFIPSYNIRMR